MATQTKVRDHRFIDGVVVKKRILAEVQSYASTCANMPRLVSILIGHVPEAAVYVRNQERGAQQAGIPFEQVNWAGDISKKAARPSSLR